MAKDFDEYRNPADKSMADLKGQIRARVAERRIFHKELAVATGKSLITIENVMYRNNMRHTWQTLIDLCNYLDIRVGLIDGLTTRRQPKELPSLTPKELRAVMSVMKELAPKKRRRKK